MDFSLGQIYLESSIIKKIALTDGKKRRLQFKGKRRGANANSSPESHRLLYVYILVERFQEFYQFLCFWQWKIVHLHSTSSLGTLRLSSIFLYVLDLLPHKLESLHLNGHKTCDSLCTHPTINFVACQVIPTISLA